MSEASVASPQSQQAYLPAQRARRSRLGSLEALERGFALFRSTFPTQAWRYYIGAAPLVLCFIPMWVANGQITLSDGALAGEAALLTGAYALRVLMVGSYVRHVRDLAFGAPTKSDMPSARAQSVARLLAWKTALTIAALTTLPSLAGASWFYSACQFASLEARADGNERHSFTGCLALASQWFGGGLLFFLMLFPLWIAVWLNGLILATVLPHLLHSIFGLNTLLSTQMGIYALVQSSAFWLSLFAGAWLALDPVVKCTFVVVYQHLRSRREGDDLRGLLASLPSEEQKKKQMIVSQSVVSRVMSGALFVFALTLGGVLLSATASVAQVTPPQSVPEAADNSNREQRVERLRQALDQEAQRAIYRWHDADHPSPPSWFDKMLSKIGHSLENAWNKLRSFLHKLWPRGLNVSLGNDKSGMQLKDLRIWLAIIAILTAAVAGVLVWLRRRSAPATLSIPMTVASIPDLSDSAVAAERSEDEWFSLATRLEAEGDLRSALRAAYFALLAGLAQREWLSIRRDRTNREYLSEFTRRWRRRPQASMEARSEIPEKLRGSMSQFDRVWYGFHSLTPEAVTVYRQDQREFLSHV